MTDLRSSALAPQQPARPLWRRAWRLLVAVKDGLVLLFLLLFFGALYALLTAGPNPAQNRGGALLLDLSGQIVEQPESADPRAVLAGQVPVGTQFRTRDLVRALTLAAQDDSIKTVVLDLSGFWGASQATLDEVGYALAKVKAAKKPIFAHATGYSDDSYHLAAHANEIWLDPMGAAMFRGPGGSRPYFKGLIDRFGVTVNTYRVGKYKSFVEPYTRADQSPEAREENSALANTLWQNWQDNIVRLRPKAKLAAFVNDPAGQVAASNGNLTAATLAAGLVDQLGDREAFGARVAKLVGSDSSKPAGDFSHTRLEDYLIANPRSTSGAAIGVVTVAGSIVDGEAPQGTAGGKTITKLIDDAVAKGNLKALVVRVDSGGGSAFASEQIRAALGRAKAKGIPVVTSMASVAASGGYWIAMAGDKVYAQPNTITGSIGVFAILPSFETTAARYGVTADGIKTTPLSGQPDILGGINEPTGRLLQASVEDLYRRFLTLVSEKRKMPVARVNEVAQGRVWDGGTARQLGLVDAFGTVDDAIAEAARLAKLDPAKTYRLDIEPEASFLSSILGGLPMARAEAEQTDVFTRAVRQQQGQAVASFRDAKALLSGATIQLRCMECPIPPSRPLSPQSGQSGWFGLVFDKVFQ